MSSLPKEAIEHQQKFQKVHDSMKKKYSYSTDGKVTTIEGNKFDSENCFTITYFLSKFGYGYDGIYREEEEFFCFCECDCESECDDKCKKECNCFPKDDDDYENPPLPVGDGLVSILESRPKYIENNTFLIETKKNGENKVIWRWESLGA